MTPREKMIMAVKNLPKEKIAGFQNDLERILEYVDSVATYSTFENREENQLIMERFSKIIFFYFKQGGMKKDDWDEFDRPVGEPHWNQLKRILEAREEIQAICEKKKEA